MIKVKSISYIQSLGNFNDVITEVEWEYIVEGYQKLGGVFGLSSPNEDNFITVNELELSVIEEWVRVIINPEEMTLVPLEKEVVITKIEF
jgi:hypothetical protein